MRRSAAAKVSSAAGFRAGCSVRPVARRCSPRSGHTAPAARRFWGTTSGSMRWTRSGRHPSRTAQPTPSGRRTAPSLLRWLAAFDAEAGTRPIDLEARVDQLIGECRALVWTDPDGSPVSVVAWSPLVAGMVRLGPAYTPPEHRRHGYASALTAAACRRALDSGARHLVLFTDLANPQAER